MAAAISTIDKLQRIESLYRQGFQSDIIELTLDKLLAIEETRAARAVEELEGRLRDFERRYHIASEEFYSRYEAGELGDDADFMEWSSFYDMWQAAHRHLSWLQGTTA